MDVDQISSADQLPQTIDSQSVFLERSDQYKFVSQCCCKSFWITDPKDFSERAKIIIREHYLLRSTRDSQDLLQGMVKIQNCSFIIETTSAQHHGFSGIRVILPAISEAFTNELLCAQYPQYSREWVSSYTSGFFMLKSNMGSDFLNSFEFFDALCDNFNKIIDSSCFVSEDSLKSLISCNKGAETRNGDSDVASQRSLIRMFTDSTDSSAIKLDVI